MSAIVQLLFGLFALASDKGTLLYSALILRLGPLLMFYRWIYFSFVTLGIFFSSSLTAIAAIDVHEFNNEVDRLRYQSFIDEMRCPKCQNQNLSGSDSPIATDLREELFRMIEAGRSDKEIVDFMVERYGEYILYRPRLSPATLLLWAGPALLLTLGIITLILILRRRKRETLLASPQDLTADESLRLQTLIEKSGSPVADSVSSRGRGANS